VAPGARVRVWCGCVESEMVLYLVWLLLTLGIHMYFVFSKNALRKRRLYPFFIISSAGLFVGLVFLGLPYFAMPVFAAVASAIAAMQIYRVRFCDNCGATTGLGNGITRPTHCHNCSFEL
jgi:hypothetical protein